jgi:hypothetical protein
MVETIAEEGGITGGGSRCMTVVTGSLRTCTVIDNHGKEEMVDDNLYCRDLFKVMNCLWGETITGAGA